MVQIIGWEFAAPLPQLRDRRLMRTLAWMHARLRRKPATLQEIAGTAGGDDVFPSGAATPGARNQMIESEFLGIAAILAFEAVAQEDVEPGKGGMTGGLDIGPVSYTH